MEAPQSFASSPDWTQYANAHGISLPSFKEIVPIDKIAPVELDYISSRARQARDHARWRAEHPLAAVGYTSSFVSVPASDGHGLEVKISYPDAERMARYKEKENVKLPVLFVAFGGGWIQGTHTTEESWLLWPVYNVFDVVVVSVAYRLGPENAAGIWVKDCWDVLSSLLSGSCPAFENLNVEMDLQKVVLAGSSAGAGIAAALSQRRRDARFPIFGVILNVPVLCDYRHFSRAEEETGAESRSYEYATEALLPSGAMKCIWDMLYSEPSASQSPDASPLLGDVRGLPRHLVFVAGQDALVDEGLAYARKLREAGVQVDLEFYKGVAHVFGEFWELEATEKWWGDLKRVLRAWLEA